jgi:hypothetical protein
MSIRVRQFSPLEGFRKLIADSQKYAMEVFQQAFRTSDSSGFLHFKGVSSARNFLPHLRLGKWAVYGTMEPTSEFPVTDEEAEIPSTYR